MTFFGGCDYLGFSKHPAVIEASREAASKHGTSVSSARWTSGNTELHDELCDSLQDLLGVEAVALTPDGMTANIAACEAAASFGHTQAAIHEFSHPTLRLAARAAGISTEDWSNRMFRSNQRVPGLILTDSVFPVRRSYSAAGDKRSELSDGEYIISDECHSLGIAGECGEGVFAMFGSTQIVLTETFAKSLGSSGGCVAGPRAFIDAVEQTATVTCTTALPPPAVGATLAAVTHMRDHPQHLERMRSNRDRLAGIFGALGHSVSGLPCPVIGFTCDGNARTRLEEAMARLDVQIPFIRYPDGPESGYFRLTVTAAHNDNDLDRLLECITAASAGGGLSVLGSAEPDLDLD